jgi:hypothetical protein
MSVTHDEARQSLDLIEETVAKTNKRIAASYAGNLLIWWGLIWIAGFTALYLLGPQGGYVFGVLDGLGVVGTILLCRKWPIRGSLRGPGSLQLVRRMMVFWLILVAYAILWVFLLSPMTGMQLGAFLVTAVMLGYAVIGLWTGSLFMLWLGLIVTGLTVFGFYILPGHFNLWMAPVGGGALLGTGLYIRLRWS